MKILLTGASGFLGQHLSASWQKKAHVSTLGRSSNNHIVCDLAQNCAPLNTFDLVVHAAGKAHMVPKTNAEEKAFFDVNIDGTKNLLSALENQPPQRFVFISTVAVYGLEVGNNIPENAPLLGETPYAKSKIKAEAEVKSWCKKHGVDYLILRLPLISGTNPPGNLGAMAHAIQNGFYFRIGKAEARRSMVGAADVAALICNENWISGVYNLTDGLHPSIAETENYIAQLFGKKVKMLPDGFIKLVAKVGDFIPKFPLTTLRYQKLKNTLTFSDEKARKELGWNPESALNQLSFPKK